MSVSQEDTDFTKPWSKSDVTFVVDKKKLYFNRGVLAFHSDVFDHMFNAKFAESDPQKDIDLPEKKFEDVQAMFFVLKAPADHASPITVNALLALSDEYQLRQLAVRCGLFILSNCKADGTRHLKAVELAFKYGMKAVAEAFLPLAACRRLSEIDAAADSLPAAAYAAILHGSLKRSGVIACSSVTHNGAAGYFSMICDICRRPKFENASCDRCDCPKNAPTNDPQIQAVLQNFANISHKIK